MSTSYTPTTLVIVQANDFSLTAEAISRDPYRGDYSMALQAAVDHLASSSPSGGTVWVRRQIPQDYSDEVGEVAGTFSRPIMMASNVSIDLMWNKVSLTEEGVDGDSLTFAIFNDVQNSSIRNAMIVVLMPAANDDVMTEVNRHVFRVVANDSQLNKFCSVENIRVGNKSQWSDCCQSHINFYHDILSLEASGSGINAHNTFRTIQARDVRDGIKITDRTSYLGRQTDNLFEQMYFYGCRNVVEFDVEVSVELDVYNNETEVTLPPSWNLFQSVIGHGAAYTFSAIRGIAGDGNHFFQTFMMDFHRGWYSRSQVQIGKWASNTLMMGVGSKCICDCGENSLSILPPQSKWERCRSCPTVASAGCQSTECSETCFDDCGDCMDLRKCGDSCKRCPGNSAYPSCAISGVEPDVYAKSLSCGISSVET